MTKSVSKIQLHNSGVSFILNFLKTFVQILHICFKSYMNHLSSVLLSFNKFLKTV